MRVKYFSPDLRLRDIIKYYWLLEIDCNETQNEQQFFPSGAIEIIFHLQTPFLRSKGNSWVPERNAFVEGQQSGILKVKQVGVMKTVGITFYPWATRYLYKTSPKVFTDTSFNINEIDFSIKHLYEALLFIGDDEDVAKACDSYFLSFIKDKPVHYKTTDLILIDLFKKPNEHFKVRELKSEWSFSSKFFEKKFNELIGVSAGELMKKRRMNKVLNIMLTNDFTSLTDVAYSAGYYDQSHFIKDFHFYFTSTPTQLLKVNHSLLKHFI